MVRLGEAEPSNQTDECISYRRSIFVSKLAANGRQFNEPDFESLKFFINLENDFCACIARQGLAKLRIRVSGK
jgi:hypothetical protein